MHTPASVVDLHRVLRDRLDGFAPGQQRIARLLLTDPEGCAFSTISELAGRAEVHESSVVRFAHALGFSGYPKLVELCREYVRDQAQLVRRFDQAAVIEGSGEHLASAISAQDQRNVARTYATIDETVWERTLTLLAEAPRVHVMGLRKCFSVAYLFAYLLQLVRPGVRQLAVLSGSLAEELRDLQPGDTFVAISIHRYSTDTVTAVKQAVHRGVNVVVLTDNAASPLARHTDLTFFVECGGVTILRSLSAFVSLCQALATATALRLGADSRSALLLDEQLLTDLDSYAVDAGRTTSSTAHAPRSTGRNHV